MTKRHPHRSRRRRRGDRGAGNRARCDARVHVADAEGLLRRLDDGDHRVGRDRRRRHRGRHHLRPDRDDASPTSQAPGTPIGSVKAQVSALALGGALLPLEGPIIVAPPGAIPAAVADRLHPGGDADGDAGCSSSRPPGRRSTCRPTSSRRRAPRPRSAPRRSASASRRRTSRSTRAAPRSAPSS